MISITLPDGRVVQVNTDDQEVAERTAAKYFAETPKVENTERRLQRGAELGEEDITFSGEAARAIGAGLIGAAEGFATLPADVTDALGITENYSENISKFYSKFKPTTHTTAGEAVKFITQFAVPGAAAAKIARARKLGLPAEFGAFSAADFVAATPDVETLGDFFDLGPTKRVETEDLESMERATANLGNRLRVAGEGAAFLLGLKAIGIGAKGVGVGADLIAKRKAVEEGAKAISDIKKPFYHVGIEPNINDPTFLQRNYEKAKALAVKNLTFRGEMPDEFTKQLQSLKIHQLSNHNQLARQSLEEIDKTLSEIKKQGLFNTIDERTTLNAINDYIFAEGGQREAIAEQGGKVLKQIDEMLGAKKPKTIFGKREYSLFTAAGNIREQIRNLSQSILDDTFLDPESNKALIDSIKANRSYYGTRMYRAMKDGPIQVTDEQREAAILDLLESNKGRKASEQLSRDDAYEIVESLRNTKSFFNANMKPNMMFEEKTLDGVAQGILKGRKLDNLPAVREFLGEYTGKGDVVGRVKQKDGSFKVGVIGKRNLEDQRIGLTNKVVETVDKQAKAITKANYLKNLSQYNEVSNTKFLFDRMPQDGLSYTRLGMEDANPLTPVSESAKQRFGPLAGKYIRSEYARAFDDIPNYINFANSSRLYATFLGLKGFSQVAKTVLSPVTQIRNATTAAFFALKNGNFGSGENLVQSFQTVASQISNRFVDVPTNSKRFATKREIDAYYRDAIDNGVVNTNAKIGEFEDLFNDALESQKGLIPGFRKPLQAAQGLQNSIAGRLYQGSDDVWKLYSWEMEIGRLKKAFQTNANATIPVTDARNLLEFGANVKPSQLNPEQFEQFVKREAASIVKDTVPNYARVPEFIKQLRQLPFGNFVAFPAEIIRTSGNIIGRAIRELSNESPEIRSIGMRRLMGAMTVDVGVGAGLMTAGTMLTGSSQEQVDAYKRSFAHDWERNAQLIPIASDEDGNITEFYNYSYTNPYDYLWRPARAVYNAVGSGITSEKDLNEIAFNALGESSREFFLPFLDESIMTEKILDITRNRNSYGGQIYNESDPFGLKAAKGFAHIADGLMPGASPVTIRGDVGGPLYDTGIPIGQYLDVEVKDFPRALGQVFGADPVTGVNRKGVRLDAAGKLAEAMSGVKTIKPDMQKTLEYRGYEAADQVREAARIFNQVVKTSGNLDAEKATDAFIVANEQRFKALRDLNMAIEDARTLGFSDSEIARSLKKAKTPQIGMLMAGRFAPFFPTKETVAKALESGNNKLSNPLNIQELIQERAKVAGQPFRPQAMAEQRAPVAPPPAPPPMPEIDAEPAEPPSLFQRGVDALRQVELDKLFGTS